MIRSSSVTHSSGSLLRGIAPSVVEGQSIYTDPNVVESRKRSPRGATEHAEAGRYIPPRWGD